MELTQPEISPVNSDQHLQKYGPYFPMENRRLRPIRRLENDHHSFSLRCFTFIFLDTIHFRPDDGRVVLQPLEVDPGLAHLHRHGVGPVGVAQLLLLQRPHEPVLGVPFLHCQISTSLGVDLLHHEDVGPVILQYGVVDVEGVGVPILLPVVFVPFL